MYKGGLILFIICIFAVMEEYRKIKGYPFEVSNLGNVRSMDREVKHWRGTLRKYKGKQKTLRLNSRGYLRTNLKHDGRMNEKRVHRLVAETFIPNPENKPQINHIDGIKTNNNVKNLEWCTQSENINHAVRTGLVKTKITDEQARVIKVSSLSDRKLAKLFGVSSSIIWRIKNGKARKYLT